MPYKNKEKLLAWRNRNNEIRRQKRAQAAAERKLMYGHHTKKSLAWPKEALSESMAMWVAACIDCEGCISLGSYWNKQRNSYNFHVNISLQMTDPSIPRLLSNICGGHVYYYERVPIKHKSIWQWHISANGVRWLLPQIANYLLVKRKQADLIIEFLTISQRGVSSRAEYNVRAQEIRSEIKNLNQRGIPTSPEGKNSELLEKPK